MGWGVAQDATFAAIIARETGRRVLNAAVSSYGTGEGAPAVMLAALRARLARPDLPAGIREARLLDVGARLGPEAFHVLDDHPNARGHRVIADAILAAIRSTMP
jgi:hypothetical protein